MGTICAWCERLIQRVAGAYGRAPSHGICSSCLQRQMQAVQAGRPALATPPSLHA